MRLFDYRFMRFETTTSRSAMQIFLSFLLLKAPFVSFQGRAVSGVLILRSMPPYIMIQQLIYIEGVMTYVYNEGARVSTLLSGAIELGDVSQHDR